MARGRVKTAGMSKTLSTVESKMQECMDYFHKRRADAAVRKKEIGDMKRRLAECPVSGEEADGWKRKIREAEDAVRIVEAGEDEVAFLMDAAPIYCKYVTAVEKSNSKKAKTEPGATGVDASVDVNRREMYREFMRAIERYRFFPFAEEQGQVAIEDQQNHQSMYGFCAECKVNMVEKVAEGELVCTKCGNCEAAYSNGIEAFPYGTAVNTADYCYKRINHFNETLSQFHARERSVIPDEVIESVRAEFKKSRMTAAKDITPENVRKFLRKLKLSKFFEHRFQITHILAGTSPPTMTTEQEERLRHMFKLMQGPFEEVCPKDRKNFLNYSYCLHKLCELMGYDEFVPYFPLLKSREKLWGQDAIWKGICGKLGWQYIPSTS